MRIFRRPRYNGTERRHWRRHHFTCLKVRIRKPLWLVLRTRLSEPYEVSNVTSHGVRFYTDAKLKAGKHIEVKFDVPEGVYRLAGDNHLRAKVTWQKWSKSRGLWRTGAQFIYVSGNMHADLSRMMKDAALHSPRF